MGKINRINANALILLVLFHPVILAVQRSIRRVVVVNLP
jgi:hypothetical protein